MSEPVFLLLETSTKICSAALWQKDGIKREIYSDEPKGHAANLAPMVDALLKETGIALNDCSAIAVTQGPGSYTGLRVGASTAKGLCFGAGKPLISIPTLDILAAMVPEGMFAYTIPMVDARRMEVYTAIYKGLVRQTEIKPLILDGHSFEEYFGNGRVAIIGDAAEKSSRVICSPVPNFIQAYPHALAMGEKTALKWAEKEFEDVAYFEPFYLKEFVPGITKKTAL
jgi:tRNA threonylcarbamoyladenosine biosynthesis protein TsaB